MESRADAKPGEGGLRWLDGVLVVELVGLTFLLGCFLDKDTDIWWHLRAGRDILAGAGIPHFDSYIFGADRAEWIDLHWGFQLLASWIFGRGGMPALTVSTSLTAATAIAVALAATIRRRSVVAAVWCWLPASVIMSARFYPRPEMLSLLCLAAALWILHAADARAWRLWFLVPLFVVWVNVHALFVLGLVALACWLVDRALRGRLSQRRPERIHLWGAPAAALAACFANPYTWKGVLFPLTLFRRMSSERGFYTQHIGELMSIPDLVARTGLSSVYLRVSLALLVVTAGSFLLRRGRTTDLYYRSLLFTLFAGLGLLASRNQPQWALIGGAVLVWNVGDWLAARPASPVVDRAISRIVTSAVLVGLMAWVASGGFYASAGEGRLVGLGEYPLWYAHDAAAFAAREGMPRYRLAYHEGQAAVLEFHMRPDQRVFVDPRLEVTPRRALEQVPTTPQLR